MKAKIMDCDELIAKLDGHVSMGNAGVGSLLTSGDSNLNWLYDNDNSGAGSSLNSGMIGGDQFNQRVG
jgi:hypothetical protein